VLGANPLKIKNKFKLMNVGLEMHSPAQRDVVLVVKVHVSHLKCFYLKLY
jgi:hypothetical protein